MRHGKNHVILELMNGKMRREWSFQTSIFIFKIFSNFKLWLLCNVRKVTGFVAKQEFLLPP
jgi:hypothetical protein